MRTMLIAFTFLWPGLCWGHDFWSNGERVPDWVKAACCGPADAHHIKKSAVHIKSDGYHIDGITTVVPIEQALPSMDGGVWGFWLPAMEPHPNIYCFFYPDSAS